MDNGNEPCDYNETKVLGKLTGCPHICRVERGHSLDTSLANLGAPKCCFEINSILQDLVDTFNLTETTVNVLKQT